MKNTTTKVAIIGAGKIGSALAYHLLTHHVCDHILLVDSDPKKARSEAWDLQHAGGLCPKRTSITAGTYYDCMDADICVLTVGCSAQHGTGHLDLLDHTASAMGCIVPTVMSSEFNGIFLVLTEPVDLMAWLVQQLSEVPTGKVIGLGTALDTARMREHLAQLLDVAPQSIEVCIMGERGENQFVAWSQVRIEGILLEDILTQDPQRFPNFSKEAICNTIIDLSHQITAGKGAPTWATATASGEIIGAILGDEKRTMAVSAMLQGEYGEDDIYIGVPAVIGKDGIESIVQYDLTDTEKETFHGSANILRDYMVRIS